MWPHTSTFERAKTLRQYKIKLCVLHNNYYDCTAVGKKNRENRKLKCRRRVQFISAAVNMLCCLTKTYCYYIIMQVIQKYNISI